MITAVGRTLDLTPWQRFAGCSRTNRMSSAHYARLNDAEHELDAAFDGDEYEHEHEPSSSSHAPSSNIPGAYDFEREYDFPPPGSPPTPSARALPNDYGNSNGLLPDADPARPGPRRPSFFRRAVGALLPSHYIRVPNSDASSSRIVGAGTENDGVFANVVAKPQGAQPQVAADGTIFMAPEETTQKDVPPSYADAQADAVPAYWETTIHAPSTDPDGPMIIDDLPTGSPWLFFTNLFISFFFQFIGFLFTYLLHTSHAAKYGSRAGLGLTLIQFGFYSRTMSSSSSGDDMSNAPVPTPLPTSNVPGAGSAPVADDTIPPLSISSHDWLAFLFMTLGWFIFLSSVIAYLRIKRWERSIRSPPPCPSPESLERDRELRRNLASVFGFSFEDDGQEGSRARAVDQRTREELEAQDARLARDLRTAGLL
ncbi:hypothetical protein H2248_008358 [Termitomyces sp. 'cryptogamus']|nr:hypothetical protein H2248_008358 [Termitomyces sp. 'cryptogamus']